MGYTQCPVTHGLSEHQPRNISFTLVVDNFRIRYANTANLNYLMAAVCEIYVSTINTSGTLYYGLTLKWDWIKID